MGSLLRGLRKRTGHVQARKHARKAPGRLNAAGKLVRARDGREALVVASRPQQGKLLVSHLGKAQLWGPEDIDELELCRVMGIEVSDG